MSQPYGLSSKGGLYTSLNQLEMTGQPGVASTLRNFEVDADGGYRRVNGFSPFGGESAVRPNGATPILGLQVYADGVIATADDDMFFSQDGTSYLQINRASVSGSGDNFSTFSGRSVSAFTAPEQSQFAVFEGVDDFGSVIMTDKSGSNKPFFFKMTGTGALSSRTFFAESITIDGSKTAKFCTVHDKHLVVAGDPSTPSTIYFSATNDPTSFSGTGSGSIALEDKIVGIKSFRNDLIIFCQNSLFKLININDSSNIAIVPITQNVGCMDGASIQEIGGDLLFLSPDGLRTVAGTARIGDVELSSVSRPIQSIIQNIADNINNFTVSSAVLRSKSQYRLFYNVPTGASETADSSAKGIIATLTNQGFQYSETAGIKATAISSDFDNNGIEKTFHGDSNGFVYNHDEGNSYYSGATARDIDAAYQTPSLDFGDAGTRKTLYYMRLSVSPEGAVQPSLRVRFDFEDPDVAQPPDYTFDSIPLPSIFGTGILGTNVFGAPSDPLVRQAIQGSGNTISFIIKSNDQKAPYTVNGMYVNYAPSGRR